MTELVAVVGCTISHSAGSPISGGAFSIVTPPSSFTSAGTPVYRGPVAFTFSGGSGGGASPGTVTGTGTFTPTASKVLADSLPVLREKDTATMEWVGTNPSPPPPTVGGSAPVEISAAGQTKAKAN